MSAGQTIPDRARTRDRSEAESYGEYQEQGLGWVVFAGTMLLMAGTLNIIYGIAAIAKSNFYVADTHFIFSDLKTWGWIILVIGILEACAGLGIYARSSWARWTGIAVASLSSIGQLLYVGAQPWLAVAIFTLDLLVIYGLVVHGGREQRA